MLFALVTPFARGQEAKPAEEPDATPLFRTSVSLIRVDAQVTAGGGRDIGDLQESDFVVFDENQVQKLVYFGRESEPIQVLFVLDVSASMWKSLQQMSIKASAALGVLRKGDQVGLMMFATRSELTQALTTEIQQIPAKITNGIYKETLGRNTVLNEALVKAAGYMRGTTAPGRKTLIVVTDNEVTRMSVRDEDVVRELHAADVVLNAILVGSGEASEKRVDRYQNPASGPPDVFQFAKATGGDVISDQEPAAALERMLKRATTRYSLHYAAPVGEPGSFRSIRVSLTPAAQGRYPGALVQARSGYEVPK